MASAPIVAELKDRAASGATASCRFCRHRATLTFADLWIPDEAVFAEAMGRRKLRCSGCRADKIGFTLEWGPKPAASLSRSLGTR
jgi:hypothetical protein